MSPVVGVDVDDLFDTAPTYSTSEAAAVCGLPVILLHRLSAAGVIAASVEAAGYGSRRRWSPAEVDRLARIADVYRTARDAGVALSWQAVADIWQSLTAGEPWRLVLEA
jgi:hypothetical protein